jgi:hypothetical protein
MRNKFPVLFLAVVAAANLYFFLKFNILICAPLALLGSLAVMIYSGKD